VCGLYPESAQLACLPSVELSSEENPNNTNTYQTLTQKYTNKRTNNQARKQASMHKNTYTKRKKEVKNAFFSHNLLLQLLEPLYYFIWP
jgi:phage protein D